MSGEPRNRRVKKRKREDDESSHGVHITKMGTDDVHLHVQEEHGTGGNWCAKVIFFALMVILLSLVGLIILENRGLSNIDTPLSESRFSNYFDGWVEENRVDDHHDAVKASIEQHDEHDEPFEEEEEEEENHSEADEDHEDDDEEADEDHDDHDEDDNDDNDLEADSAKVLDDGEDGDAITKEDEDDDNEDDDGDDDNEKTVENDDDNEDENADNTVEKNDDDTDIDDDEDDENNTQEQSRVASHDNDDDEDNDANDNDDDDENDDPIEPILTRSTLQSAATSRQQRSAADDNDNENDNDDDEDDENNEQSKVASHDNDDDEDDANDNDDDDENNDPIEPILTRSTRQSAANSRQQKSEADDNDNDDPFDEDDDDDGTFESLENVVDNDAEELKLLQEKARQQTPPQEDKANSDDEDDVPEAAPSWATLLAVKIGVGVALALVARFVLIRKNPNTNDEPAAETLMKRRLTIACEEVAYGDDEDAPPLSEDELGSGDELEVEEEEEIEYVEEEEEIEIEVDENGDEVKPAPSLLKYVPETFEELSSMYRTKTYADQTETDQAAPSKPTTTTPSINRIEKFRAEKYGRPMPPTTITNEKPTTIKNIQQPPAPPPRFIEPKLKSTSYTPLAAAAAAAAATAAGAAVFSQPLMDRTDKAAEQKLQQQSAKNQPSIQTEVTTREVTHDLDYQPDEEEIDYTDEDYGEEENVEEEEEEIEDILDDEDLDDVSDVDDAELMSRLEAKYGRLPATKEYESDEDPDDPTWTQIKPKSTARDGAQAHEDEIDESFERDLRRANEEMMRERYSIALQSFTVLSQKYPERPAAFLGKAKCLDKLSEQQRSNKLLEAALEAYKRYLALDDKITDAQELRQIAEHCIERIRFMGYHHQAVPIHQQLIARFPRQPALRNQLAVTYLMMNRLADAKIILQETLQRWPHNGFALVHFGFVLKNLEQDYAAAAQYLQKGIDSQEEGTQDGRFYFNLGDVYQRLGLAKEAYEIYKRGAALKLFPSMYQRSLYNERNLRAKPYWTKEETSYERYLNKLERNWQAIRDEALSLLSQHGYFVDEAENLRDTGDWKQFELYARGQRLHKNCLKAPITCSFIEEFKAAANCRRGQVKFSIMHGGTHVFPHCGPTNCRLRAHLGLVVPPQGPRLRVADKVSNWTEGKFLIFDDSFEHEVWHEGSSLRLVLIVDVWHPDLSEQQRQNLTPI